MRALAVLLLVATSHVAMADSRQTITPEVAKLYSESPVVELVTMGIGSLIWERHGHIAICVTEHGLVRTTPDWRPGMDDRCYNYGIGDFADAVGMGWGFFRGAKSFWVGRSPPNEMFWIYKHTDRTIWTQPLPLTAAQKQQVIDKLESDIKDENRYYAYDHFWDNCTTRVRDVIDHATDGALSSMTDDPTDGRTYRDLARDGFVGMHENAQMSLLITDLAMGRVTDRVPSYWERMFLPQYLREAVVKRWNIQPIVLYERHGDAAIANRHLCSDGNVTESDDDCVPSGPSGRLWFAIVILVMTAPAWITRRLGRFPRLGIGFSIVPPVLLGLVFWALAIISPLPYVRWNESCLVFFPFDLLLVVLPDAKRRLYGRGRVYMLGAMLLLLLVGVLRQPLFPALLWPLIPAAVVGFWPATAKKPRS